MNIGFEAKRFFTNYTGLGNYSRFVLDALSKYHPENHYALFTPKGGSHKEFNDIINRANVGVVKPRGIFRFLPRVWRTIGMSWESDAKQLDIFHGLSQELPFYLPENVKKIVTVHDLIFLRYPRFYQGVDVAIYKTKVKSACERADKIIAISSQTAQDVVDYLKIDPSKIEVVYQGCHPNFKRKLTEAEKLLIKKKYSLPDQFILNVGTIEKRKNIGLLVEAVALLPEELRLPIVIIGRSSSYLKEVLKIAKQKKVYDKLQLLSNASFEDFPGIYQQARVFVYPSLFEGFGIPLVEAIESGIPVITSKGSCFIEAAGPNALYVDPHRADELSSALTKVLTNVDLQAQMVANSSIFVEQFRPEVIASRLNAIYLQLADPKLKT